MSFGVQLVGVRETMQALRDVPRRVQLRHVRIAMNKGAGMLRDSVSRLTPVDTGLLAKSYKVKVKVPDASYNAAHHGKPAYAVIGATRSKSPYRRMSRSGRLIGFGAANKAFGRELKAGAKLRVARGSTESAFSDAIYRSPSRYVHLVEKGRSGRRGRTRAVNMHLRAAQMTGPSAQAAVVQKLRDGLIMEANLAYARSIGKFR